MCAGSWLTANDADPTRVQIVELPEIKPHVTEHRGHALTCPDCGTLTREPLPTHVLEHGFGPRVAGLVAYFTGFGRLSKRQVVEVFEDAFGTPISLGAVCALEQDVAAAIAAPVEEARVAVRKQAVVHMDETGWREDKKRDRAVWEEHKPFRKLLGGNPIKVLTVADILAELLPKIGTTPEGTEIGRLLQVIKASGVEPDFGGAAKDGTKARGSTNVIAGPGTKGGARTKTSGRVTVASVVRELVRAGKTNQEIWETIQPQFGLDEGKRYYLGWCRAEMRRNGIK